MSLPTSGYGTVRRLRQSSVGSASSPRLIPRSSDHFDAASSPFINPVTTPHQGRERALSITSLGSQREPTRSSVHLSYRGTHGTLNTYLAGMHKLIESSAPLDNSHLARSVREDTADLASYALSDRASTRSVSPRPRTRNNRPAQNSIDSYFAVENDGDSLTETDHTKHDTIEEVSEPVSPESREESRRSPKGSIIGDMLRESPLNVEAEDDSDGHSSTSEGEESDEDVTTNGRLIITSNGVERDTTERTPLIARRSSRPSHHPDWIHGVQDVEAQVVKRKLSWPKLRNVAEKGADAVKTVCNPKRWNKRSIVEGAKTPFQFLPAVVLGLLLNILDALSYGMSG